MLKVNYCKPKFIQNENCVICLLKISVDLYQNYYAAVRKWIKSHPSLKVRDLRYGFTATAIGIAHCSDNDTFDEKFGRQLAEARARRKLYGFLSTLTDKIIDEKNKECKALGTILNKYYKCRDAESKHIEYLLKNS